MDTEKARERLKKKKGMQAAANPPERTPAYIEAREELGWYGTPKNKGIMYASDKKYREIRRKAKDVAGVLKEKFYDPYMSVFGGKE